MNILCVCEKPSIAKMISKSLQRIGNNDNFYFDYVRCVFNINDSMLLFRKHNNSYYRMGKKENWECLTLKSIDIPIDSYLQNNDSKIAYINHNTLPKIDKYICMCDSDYCGTLAFTKYLEEFNIPFDKAFIYTLKNLTSDYLDNILQEDAKPFIPYFEKTKNDLIKCNFELNNQKKRNINMLRAETNLNRTDFANYFNIPYRTLENWEKNKAKCPDYLYDLIEYKLEKENMFFND